ncbi:capsular polysaccharide synthesis protein [Microlunatus soli]|nr:capsular polysaccharide synthesis protein [Microlunatus soli]
MQPGKFYTCSVDVVLSDPLTGPLAQSRLSIAAGAVIDGSTKWALASSDRAPNEPGRYRIMVRFRVPEEASEAWIRLICGMTANGGAVGWDRFQLTQTVGDIDYFDGDESDDRWYSYRWAGEPGASESVRTMIEPSKSWPGSDSWATPDRAVIAEIFAQIVARATHLAVDEAMVLGQYLDQVRAGEYADLSAAATLLISEAERMIATRREADVRSPASKIISKTNNQLVRLLTKPHSPILAELVGGRLSDQGAWAAAVDPLREAVDGDAGSTTRYRLAFALERTGQRAEIGKLVRSTAAAEAGAPFDVRRAAEIDVNRFAPRREVGEFLAEHLSEIRLRADHTARSGAGGLGEFPIFTYWGQGYHDAPPVVRACRRALERHNPPDQLHFIDDATLPYYADFPDSLMRGSVGQRALFSDALRVELLARYGGIWVDATCLTTAPLTESVTELAGSGFFAFNYVESRISSWFMVSRQGSRIVALLRAALLTWFEHRQDLIDYYLIHHLFEMLYRLEPGFAEEWDGGIRLGSRPPHALQVMMYEPLDSNELDRVLRSSFIHKLTHKLNRQHRDGFISSDSYLAAVIRGAGESPARSEQR